MPHLCLCSHNIVCIMTLLVFYNFSTSKRWCMRWQVATTTTRRKIVIMKQYMTNFDVTTYIKLFPHYTILWHLSIVHVTKIHHAPTPLKHTAMTIRTLMLQHIMNDIQPKDLRMNVKYNKIIAIIVKYYTMITILVVHSHWLLRQKQTILPSIIHRLLVLNCYTSVHLKVMHNYRVLRILL